VFRQLVIINLIPNWRKIPETLTAYRFQVPKYGSIFIITSPQTAFLENLIDRSPPKMTGMPILSWFLGLIISLFYTGIGSIRIQKRKVEYT